MAGYRCFFFETYKLAGSKDFENKSTAENSAKFGLRWGPFDRAEIWAGDRKLETWTKDGEEVRAALQPVARDQAGV